MSRSIEDILPPKSVISDIVIDTNLLLLLLIGSYDKKRIETAKVISKYSIADFKKIVYLIDYYDKYIIITPNILTEVCNLSDKLNSETNLEFFKHVEKFIHSGLEHIEKSAETIRNNNKCFIKFGISDASIFNLAKSNNLIITDDLKLYHFLISQNHQAINYTHLIQL